MSQMTAPTWWSWVRARFWLPLLVLSIGCADRKNRETAGQNEDALVGNVTLTLTAPKNVPVLSPTLSASNAIFMGAGSEVVQPGLSVAMGSGGLRTEPDVLMNETWSRGLAELRDRTKIRGTLHSKNPKLFQNVTITTKDNNPVFDPVSSLSWTVNFPAGGSDVPISPDKTGSIAPGRYAVVSVGARATLTLSAGTYFLTKLLVEPQAVVRLNQAAGPVIIYVSDVFQPRGTFVSNVTGTDPDLFVGFLGTTSTTIDTVPFNGAVVAPFGQLVLRAFTNPHVGFYAAKDLLIDAHARVRYRAPNAIVGAAQPPNCSTYLPPDLVARYCPPSGGGGGCPDIDSDRDGVKDCNDRCPYDPLKTVPGACNCGSPETDSDNDTIPDCIDFCRFDDENTDPGQCGCKFGSPDSPVPPAGTPCTDPACPQVGSVCDGAGVCGDRDACSPCPGGRYYRFGTSGYWLCGVPVTPTLPAPDGGLPWDGGYEPTPPADAGSDAGSDGGTDGGGPPPTGAQPRGNASSMCAAKGMNLLRIDGPEENRNILRLITHPLWLGANSITTANTWRWSTSTSNNGDQFWSGGATGARVGGRYANWFTNAPATQRCAVMRPFDGRWVDVDCAASYGFICEVNDLIGGGASDGGIPVDPPGIQEDPPTSPEDYPCVPEQDSGLPDSYAELQFAVEQADAGIYVGAAANPPPEDASCPPIDPASEAVGLEERAGCAFSPASTAVVCYNDDDCAAFPGTYCRQRKIDPACTPPDGGEYSSPTDSGVLCKAQGMCGTLTCPPIDPPRCDQVEICNPGNYFDAGEDPGSNLAPSPLNPASLFDGGLPDAAPTAEYVDPPGGSGKNHTWCKLNPQNPDSVPPAAVPSSTKSGSSGGGTKISFSFDPDLIFDAKANPLSFGEADLSLHAQAKFVATASLNDFLGQSYTAPIIDVVAGIQVGRCSISTDETHFQVLGLDFVDKDDLPNINTFSPEISEIAYEAAKNCQAGLDNFKLWGDRAKKAFRDAQNVVKQYQQAKLDGKAFGTNLCQQLGLNTATVPYFPGGNICAPNEPPEITINRLISFYQDPRIGQISQLKDAAAGLQAATAGLRDLLGTEIGVDFIDKNAQESQTIVNVPFAIGPIPMVLQIDVFAKYGISGRFQLNLNFPTNLMQPEGSVEDIAHISVQVGPHASAGLSAFVGAGISLGPIEATLGLEGAITLADVRVPIFAGAGLKLQVDKDPRPLPIDIRPPVSVADSFPLGIPRSFKFSVNYDYGVGLDLLNVLDGELNARLRIKFFFFSRTWRKRIVHFNGWDFHYNLVSDGSNSDITLVDFTVPGTASDGRSTTKAAQGETTMGRSESQVPLTTLAALPVPAPVFNGDTLVDGGAPPPLATLSKTEVETFFYDDLCCSKESEECQTSGTPACCPNLTCVPTEEGGTTGTCMKSCADPGESCYGEGGLPCCQFPEVLGCGEDGRCYTP